MSDPPTPWVDGLTIGQVLRRTAGGFESVDPVSAANIEDVLRSYTASGGSVIVSSHSMDLVQRMCDHVAVIAAGRVLAAGTIDEVRAGESLQDRFVSLVGGRHSSEGPQWLRQS